MSGRVIHLIDTGGPGGAETVFHDLVRRLPIRGWKSVPVLPEPGWLKEQLVEDDMSPVVLPNDRSFDVRYLFRLNDLLRRNEADLVQTHLLSSGVYGTLAAAACGLPAVCTIHGKSDICAENTLDRLKLRILNRSRTRVVFVSQDLRRHVVERTALTTEQTAVIHNGIDVDRYAPRNEGSLRREIGVGRDEILVGAIGNVRPAKQYGLFLESAALLLDRRSRYRFVVVGERQHELYPRLLELRADLGLTEVFTFTGLRDDIPAVLADLDVYVLTSSSEGFSLSTVEALASEVPVVATRCGGPEEIIEDGVDGRLVESGSARAVADAVDSVITDPEGARRMAREGRRKATREFSVERMIDRYSSLYETMTTAT